ncbi:MULTISPECIES: YceI family protein [Flavobacterium]|uniref:YceI family protein n=1 Tax=Flavobacterium columnare TaxID=996 RepID=A0A437UEX4_9FLAO|nr:MULTISPECIES: YceI family protein [Flavobacterium]QYS88609.1 YceI family protein [Flavobacterium davisii]RVU92068.1 YceI family protein [Flavobacterium columnare]
MKKLLIFFYLIVIYSLISCKKESTTAHGSYLTHLPEIKGIKYQVDTLRSTIYWTGFKPSEKHTGTLKLKEGLFICNQNTIALGRFYMNMNSITVTDLKDKKDKNKLENHLKGLADKNIKDHFFNISKYPISDFRITHSELKNNKTIIYGNLTIKGITKSVNFPAKININNDQISLKSDTLQLNRTYWNVNYGSKSIFDDLKDEFISDQIHIQVNLIAKKIKK